MPYNDCLNDIMVIEIKSPQIIETFEKPNGVETKINKKTTSKTFRGLINGYIHKISNMNDNSYITKKELELMFNELLKKFNEFYPQEITKITILEGWEKSDGEYLIGRNFDNDFIVEIWHKENKERKVVKKEELNRMLEVIRKLEIGKVYKCYDIAKLMNMEWKYVWANRMTIYFPYYYVPLKILAYLKVIDYGGNKKSIIRLK